MKIIFDVKGLIMHSFYRCKDSGSHLRDEQGKAVTTAEAGLATFIDSYLLPVLESVPAIDIVACWEGGNVRRKELFPDYKKKREEQPKDPVVEEQLSKLYDYVKRLLLNIGATNAIVDTVEADDLIAYIAKNYDGGCMIYTVDADLLQLQEEGRVEVFYRGEYADDFEPKCPPHLTTIYKTIVGDQSDGYGGVPRLGQKAWEAMVEMYGEDGMAELEEIARTRDRSQFAEIVRDTADEKYLGKILENWRTFCLMYQLAVLHPEWCECTFKRKLIRPKWHRRVPHYGKVQMLLQETGNEPYMAEIEDKVFYQSVLIDARNVDEMLYDGDLLDDLNARPVAFDYETTDENMYECFRVNDSKYVDTLSSKITGASFCWGENYDKVVYINFGHKDAENRCSLQVLEDMLGEIEELVVFNSGFEEVVTAVNLPHLRDRLFGVTDAMVMANYVDENERNNLKHRSKHHLNMDQGSYSELMTRYDAANMAEITGEQACEYGAEDAIATAHLHHHFQFVMSLEGTLQFCEENEFITSSVFNHAFMVGCNIDWEQLELMRGLRQKELDAAYAELRGILEEGCTEPDEEATEAYMAEVREYEIAKLKDAGKTEEEITEALTRMRERFLEGTVYKPFVERVVEWNFIPTVAKFRDIFEQLNGGPLEEEEDYLTTHAPTKISEQFALKRDRWNPDILEFMKLVCEAAHQFKAREGEEYEKLRARASEIMASKAKVQTEGTELNFDSPVQSAYLLYGMLALPVRHRSKVNEGSKREELGFPGGPSTDDKAIEIAMAEDAPEGSAERHVLELVREIKNIETQFKYYFRPYPNWRHPDTGRIHPAIRNCTTVTRRPTGVSPNALQVKKGPIRSIYLPCEDDHILIAPDFAGQELRLIASESKDETLIEAFCGEVEKDVHSLTGSAILPGIAKALRPDLVEHIQFRPDNDKAQTYDQFMEWRESDQFAEFAEFIRGAKRAKAVNFLVNYEGGASTLSTNILVPQEEAQQMIDDMFALYPGIPKFQEESHRLASLQGYVTTAYGNRRHMTSAIVDKDSGKRMRMERQASNFRIQGCAADILKKVVSEAHRSGLLKDCEAVVIAPVYDELVNSVPIKHAVEFCQRLEKIMNITPPGHRVPMVSEFKLGFDWFNMVEIKRDTREETILAAIAEARAKRTQFKQEQMEAAA